MHRLLCIVLLLLAGCGPAPKVHTIQGEAEGTTWQIRWWSAAPVDIPALRRSVEAAIESVDQQISSYQKDSDIEKFNRSPSTHWQSLPADVVHLLSIAHTINRESNGCYDPTVKPLFDLWGFDGDRLIIPTPTQIAAVRQRMGMSHVMVDATHDRVRKTIPSIELDLSSMGEGYTNLRFARVLEQAGIHDYLVEIGGDLLSRGHKPGGAPWRVAIEKPVPGTLAIDRIITITGRGPLAIDTSGTYRHYFEKGTHTYAHILDPRTGAPVTHDTVSATVFGPDPRVTDAWATAMLCLGRGEGEAIANKLSLPVLFIEDKKGKLVETRSRALTAMPGLSIR